MNGKRFAEQVAFAAGIVFLLAAPGLARSNSSPNSAAQSSKGASPATQPKGDSLHPDDFAGLNLTDEQKAEIDRIHRETESHKSVVVNDSKLTADQKDAMLFGYTRIEYGSIFSVLSPEQQKQVRQKLLARRAADQAEQRKQRPLN
jgi:Spy/CpxP family protein refolding chaperone